MKLNNQVVINGRLTRQWYNTNSFIIGQNLETHITQDPSELVLNGMDTSSQALPVTLYLNTSSAVPSGVTLYAFLHVDRVLNIQPDGSCVVLV